MRKVLTTDSGSRADWLSRYRDSGWHTLRVGELKCLLALCRELVIALEWTGRRSSHYRFHLVERAVNLFPLPKKRASSLAGTCSEAWSSVFDKMFEPRSSMAVWAHIHSEARFFGLAAGDLSLSSSRRIGCWRLMRNWQRWLAI